VERDSQSTVTMSDAPLSFGLRLTPAVLASLAIGCGSPAQSGFGGSGVGPNSGPGMGVDEPDASLNLGGGNHPAEASTDGPIDTTASCDTGLAVDDGDPASFAKAIGICTTAASSGYGLVSATYSNAYGSTAPPHEGQWGFLPKFGSVIVPREGATLAVLSSGFAREYDDAAGVLLDYIGTAPWMAPSLTSDFVNSSPIGPLDGRNYPTGQAPPGFPQAARGCAQDNKVNDMIDVKLVLKAPPNATGFRFDFDFYSSEWPNFVCSNFNDAFIAYLTSRAVTNNISFDSNGDPIAVNTNFFNRCTPNTPVGCLSTTYMSGYDGPPINTSTCSSGPSELMGTGFGDTLDTQCDTTNVSATLGGATGWLTTQAPIGSGEEFTLEFMIWDAGDGFLDSSVLIDHFQWIGGVPVTTSTGRPPK
jgi:hypothetical protein